MEEVRSVLGGEGMEGLVGEREDFIIGMELYWEPTISVFVIIKHEMLSWR